METSIKAIKRSGIILVLWTSMCSDFNKYPFSIDGCSPVVVGIKNRKTLREYNTRGALAEIYSTVIRFHHLHMVATIDMR